VQLLPPLLVDNRWIRSDIEKVELYANHLQQVFTPHSSQLLLPPPPEMECVPPKSFSFSPKAVAAVIDKLNIKKAPGADRITGRMLRELPRLCILWLTRIFNAILRFGTFPSA